MRDKTQLGMSSGFYDPGMDLIKGFHRSVLKTVAIGRRRVLLIPNSSVKLSVN